MTWMAAGCLIFMMLAICYSVLSRYFWNRPIPWIVEISSYLMLYITFLGTGWLQRHEGHVGVDLLVGRLSPRPQAALKALTSVFGAAVGFVLAFNGTRVTLDYYHREVTSLGILNTPQYLLLMVIPLGGFLLFIEFVLRSWKYGHMAMKGIPDVH
jgi:TRAP-type C4-dicarboxylate transport system permease small subunit